MPKKIPMRMCVACREMRPKKELIRVVRTPEGGVTLDRTGRANGRGAYLCDSVDCLSRAVKTRALERALETRIDESIFDSLREALHAGAKAE
ncbi:MAG: YlxR family protein [bacterium]|nr:YlxR family protein [bacterium]